MSMIFRHLRILVAALTLGSNCTVLNAQTEAIAPTYTPAMRLTEGRQIVAVYIGGENCGACNFPEVKKAVEEMKSLVSQQAKKSGASFAAIGVANDWDLKTASDFIARNGAWDQLVLGGNWTNIGIDQFMWKDAKALAALPQIVIVERTVTLGAGVMISEPKFLRRIVGGDSIPAWVRSGAPIAPAKP